MFPKMRDPFPGTIQPDQIIAGSVMVLIRGIRFVGQNDGVRSDEPRQVVHVTVRVIADDALAQPDRSLHPEVVTEDLLVLRSAHSGVSHLRIRKEPLLGNQQQVRTVALDPTALQHQRGSIRPRRAH